MTDRGRLVARLVPAKSDDWEQLVTSGRVTLADPDVDILDVKAADYGFDASAALGDLREHER